MPNDDVVRAGLIVAGMLIGPLMLAAFSLLRVFVRAAESDGGR